MAIATATSARATLGIDHADDHLVFRLASSAALDTVMTASITRAVALLKAKADSTYYDGTSPGPSSTDIDELFKGAEELVAGHFLFLRLKARKVFGTHAPFDSEESDRYQELIDQELLSMAEELVEPYLETPLDTEEEEERPYSLGAFVVSEALDRENDVDCVTDRNQAILDEVTCGGNWWTR